MCFYLMQPDISDLVGDDGELNLEGRSFVWQSSEHAVMIHNPGL